MMFYLGKWKYRATYFEGAYLCEYFKMMPFLYLVKDKKVHNVHVKFHNNPSIFQFMVEIAIHGDHWNESIVCQGRKECDNCLLLGLLGSILYEVNLPSWDGQESHLLSDFFVHAPNQTPKNEL